MFDLAIVGAGPAGMSAALTAADHGLTVVVVDEQQRAGGQIFRQPPEDFSGSALHPTAGYGWATDLIRRFETDSRLTTEFGWSAIGVLSDDTEPDCLRVAINHPEHGTRVLGTRRLLIATGAYDLPVAFPGWTLPGVMTAGGVQTLVKAQKMAPVGDVVLAGAHPCSCSWPTSSSATAYPYARSPSPRASRHQRRCCTLSEPYPATCGCSRKQARSWLD
ncbi:FAD-dependent oxidoreductase [Streptomyces aureus]